MEFLAGLRIPQADPLVPAAHGQCLAIGRKDQGEDAIVARLELTDFLASVRPSGENSNPARPVAGPWIWRSSLPVSTSQSWMMLPPTAARILPSGARATRKPPPLFCAPAMS